MTLEYRVFKKVRMTSTCWWWTGQQNGHGYGLIRVGRRKLMAHRVVYEMRVGAIPNGFQLDHLCRNRACVNPTHLEPVIPRTNVLRGVGHSAVNASKTHCIHGHKFTAENTYIDPRGYRACRTCAREAQRRYKASAS